MNKKISEYAFVCKTGLSRRTKRRLLQQYSEEEILLMSDQQLEQLLSSTEWKHYWKNKSPFNIEETKKEWKCMEDKGIDFIYHKDGSYPNKLRQIEDWPLALFKRGKIPANEKTIAIVGSRVPTVYGTEMAAYFGRELAKEGVSIISGLAYGIDVAAHKGALTGGGLTFGVLGCGVDIVYPKENYDIYERMMHQGGLISEYIPGTTPEAFRFPERNRIISGLSDGVLVVESKGKGGSLITADQALEQGKTVYALPGRSIDPLSEGCNWLIREGATLVTKPYQILDELFQLYENKQKNTVPIDNLLDMREKIVYDCLSLDPKSIEEIIHETNFTVTEVISILFQLELRGMIRQIVRNHYIITI